MKGMFKRALAGVAAAALAVTGLALGAGAANAAQTDPDGVVTENVKFTFTANTESQLTNRDLDAYKIGNFVQYGTDPDFVYGVETVDGVNRTALKTALEAAGFTGMPTDDTTDLLAWALSQTGTKFDHSSDNPWGVGGDSASRKFADSLAASLKDTPATKENILSGHTPTGSDDAGYSVSVDLPAGLYLFIDRTPGTVNVTKAVPMLASTGGTPVDGKLTSATNLVSINFKNETNTDWKKTASDDSVTVGQRLTYTLEGTVPATGAEGFAFYDIPGTGLSIDPNSIKVYEDKIAEANQMQQDDYTVVWGKDDAPWTSDEDGLYVGNGSNMFTVSIGQPVTGAKYFVTYEAVVNSAAANRDKVVNRLTDKNGNDIITPVESNLFKFDFTKQDAQGNKLGGVTFTIYDDKGVALPDYTGGSNGDSTSTSDENGKVEFKGLAAGKYTVKETVVKDGFMDMKLSFTVTIDDKGVATFSADAWGLVDNNDKTVTNVRKVTELPLTGAAGTALFTVLGLLIAGAGALVYMKSRYMKSRSVKHALRG